MIGQVSWQAPTEPFLQSLRGLTTRQETDAIYARCRWDIGLFCLTYLPDRFVIAFNAVHHALLLEQREPWYERKTKVQVAEAAPRGVAKSTIESWAKVIHAVVYGIEAFIGIAAADYDLSEDLVADIHEVFSEPEAYADLHRDYGPLTCRGGKTDFVVRVHGQDSRGCRIKALSMGGSIRGKKHKGIRFTLIILDDAEHPARVRSAKIRDDTWDFLNKDVLKAGRKGTIFRVVGTILHADSMLARLAKAPSWTYRAWRALISWPDRMDLWSEAQLLWSDLANDDRVDDAMAFYRDHQAEMDAGAEVVWPEDESLWDLMVLWWEDASSFYSEKQNQPRDPARQRFIPEDFRKCRVVGDQIESLAKDGTVIRAVALSSCRLVAWLDPSVGKSAAKGDYWALTWGAVDPSGWRYVLGTVMQRSTASTQRAAVWSLFERHQGIQFGIEDNGFQSLFSEAFEREKEARRAAGKPWRINISGYTSTMNKIDRIDCLETPLMAHGWLMVADDTPGDVLEQFRDFPNAAHDDGPDAIERLDWLLQGGDNRGRIGKVNLNMSF